MARAHEAVDDRLASFLPMQPGFLCRHRFPLAIGGALAAPVACPRSAPARPSGRGNAGGPHALRAVRERTDRAPGWYPDPRDPTAIRYHDGRAWTDRRRPRPGWARRGASAPPAVRRRRRLAFLAATLALVAVAAGLVAALLTEPTAPAPRIADRSFTRAANAVCARRLPALRELRPQPRSEESREAPEDVAVRVDKAASDLAAVTGELRSLPVARADAREVDAWLADWDAFVAVGRRYAEALRRGRAAEYTRAAAAGAGPRARIFAFSRANGMPACVLR